VEAECGVTSTEILPDSEVMERRSYSGYEPDIAFEDDRMIIRR
jgi:hypothetical protein